MQCPYCGENHPDYAKFCPTTGQPISTQPDSAFQPGRRSSLPVALGGVMVFIFLAFVVLWLFDPWGFFHRGSFPPAHQSTQPEPTATSPAPTPAKISTWTLIPTVKTNPNPIPVPTRTPTTASSCPGAAPQRLSVGDWAWVCTQSDRLIVRTSPEPGDNEMFRIYPGTEVEIIGGPRCSDHSSWWLVRVSGGTQVFRGKLVYLEQESSGWVREGSDNKDPYYLCKR